MLYVLANLARFASFTEFHTMLDRVRILGPRHIRHILFISVSAGRSSQTKTF